MESRGLHDAVVSEAARAVMAGRYGGNDAPVGVVVRDDL